MVSGDGSYVFGCLVTCFWGLVLGNMFSGILLNVIWCLILLCQLLGALFSFAQYNVLDVWEHVFEFYSARTHKARCWLLGDSLARANVRGTTLVLRGMSPGQRLTQPVRPTPGNAFSGRLVDAARRPEWSISILTVLPSLLLRRSEFAPSKLNEPDAVPD